jgi:dynein heavy chain, axonemal
MSEEAEPTPNVEEGKVEAAAEALVEPVEAPVEGENGSPHPEGEGLPESGDAQKPEDEAIPTTGEGEEDKKDGDELALESPGEGDERRSQMSQRSQPGAADADEGRKEGSELGISKPGSEAHSPVDRKPKDLLDDEDYDFGIPPVVYTDDMDEIQKQKAEDERLEKIRFARQLEKDKKDNRLLWMINQIQNKLEGQKVWKPEYYSWIRNFVDQREEIKLFITYDLKAEEVRFNNNPQFYDLPKNE